jgi:hypothetical protein
MNKGFESEQPTRPVNLRDDGVDIDLPSHEEIKMALKYLKNNKAAGNRRRYNHELDKECPKFYENKQIAIRWSHDQKTRRPTTKSSIQRNQGRPKSRWVDGVNSDSLALGV